MTPIAEDERLKAGIHGAVFGIVLPVWIFNVVRGQRINTAIYTGILLLEAWQIAGHLWSAREESDGHY